MGSSNNVIQYIVVVNSRILQFFILQKQYDADEELFSTCEMHSQVRFSLISCQTSNLMLRPPEVHL